MKQILLCLTFFTFSLQGCMQQTTQQEECLQHLPDDLKKECLDFAKLFKRSQLDVPKALLLCRNLEMYGYKNAVEYIRKLAHQRFNYDLQNEQARLNVAFLRRITNESKHTVIATDLLVEGADVNAIDDEISYIYIDHGPVMTGFHLDRRKYYATALMKAAKLGSLDIVNFLLDMGASRTLRDAEGKTAYDYAHLTAIAKLLEFDDTLEAAVTESFEYLSTRGTNVPKEIEGIIVSYAEEKY